MNYDLEIENSFKIGNLKLKIILVFLSQVAINAKME